MRKIVFITVRIYNRYNMGAILKIKYSTHIFFNMYRTNSFIKIENHKHKANRKIQNIFFSIFNSYAIFKHKDYKARI